MDAVELRRTAFEVTVRNLRLVGPEKPVGYLPLRTITFHLGLKLPALVAELVSYGLETRVYGPKQCVIRSGALYVFHRQAVEAIIEVSKHELLPLGWPTHPDGVIDAIASRWLEDNHTLMPFIRRLFADH